MGVIELTDDQWIEKKDNMVKFLKGINARINNNELHDIIEQLKGFSLGQMFVAMSQVKDKVVNFEANYESICKEYGFAANVLNPIEKDKLRRYLLLFNSY